MNLPDMQGRGSLGHMGCWTPLPGNGQWEHFDHWKICDSPYFKHKFIFSSGNPKMHFCWIWCTQYLYLVYDVREELVAEAILFKVNSIWSQFERTAFLSSKAQHKQKHQHKLNIQMQVPGTCVAPLWVWLPWKKLEPKVTMWKASAILATVSWLNAQSW